MGDPFEELIKQKDKLSKLLEEIKTTQNIYERDWLLAKVTGA